MLNEFPDSKIPSKQLQYQLLQEWRKVYEQMSTEELEVELRQCVRNHEWQMTLPEVRRVGGGGGRPRDCLSLEVERLLRLGANRKNLREAYMKVLVDLVVTGPSKSEKKEQLRRLRETIFRPSWSRVVRRAGLSAESSGDT